MHGVQESIAQPESGGFQRSPPSHRSLLLAGSSTDHHRPEQHLRCPSFLAFLSRRLAASPVLARSSFVLLSIWPRRGRASQQLLNAPLALLRTLEGSRRTLRAEIGRGNCKSEPVCQSRIWRVAFRRHHVVSRVSVEILLRASLRPFPLPRRGVLGSPGGCPPAPAAPPPEREASHQSFLPAPGGQTTGREKSDAR